MKKILFILLTALMFSSLSCKDYLEVSSPSNVDEDFVFTTPDEAFKVLAGCYEIWRNCNNSLFYDVQVVGSDAECHPESYDAQTRHIPEGLYAADLTIDFADAINSWASFYQVANRANIILKVIGAKPDFIAAKAAGKVTAWTQLYGEAVTFRASAYHELIRYFGDVPHFSEAIYSTEQTDGAACVSRDEIYDFEIAALREVEPLMYRVGEGNINAERFNRSFVQGLIARMALHAGGYGLRRTDFNYGTATFTQLGSVMWNAKYVRRTDYKKYYDIAKIYLDLCISNSGTAQLITTDSRGAGYDNPFQRNFQYNMDLAVSPESLFEIAETQGQFSERPYAIGRPSDGGGSNAFPCKDYGQSRMYPAFYYGDYDPKDIRRDVTTTVTSNSGACVEKIIAFIPGSRSNGGLPNNKWDESRMAKPYTTAQRMSGINWPIMRMADVVLMMAEVSAELGDEARAKTELTKVRSRAFLPADRLVSVTNYINNLSGDALKDAIQQERKLEFAGEGLRRYDLIRTGKMPEKIKQVRDLQVAMVNGLKTKGYYTFPNGNTISNYIWVKSLNVSTLNMTKMLTYQCEVPETDPTWPVRFPSWRGQCDLWTSSGYTNLTGNRNLAIQGLFRYIDPASAEALALQAAGYVKTAWGSNIVANEAHFTSNVFKGYTDAYYAAGTPPRYLFAMPSETISKSKGLITNGYGFAQQ
ncbi:MAG: RagB/SusD family nutrient uptake outer membrane protein [Prolixibacteraceae bacterium]